MAKDLEGIRVLFIVRNPQGLGTLISYFTTRKVKTWTVNSIKEAPPKITENKIDVVIISVNLKNVQIETVVTLIKSEFKVPSIVFAEENSRKIESEINRLNVPYKIIPPNQNSKFMHALQLVLGENVTERPKDVVGKNREHWLPVNAVPVEADKVPKEGKWIMLDPDPNEPPPYTFKLAQPRGTAGSARYFYVGDAAPTGTEISGFHVAEKLAAVATVESTDDDIYDGVEFADAKRRPHEPHYEFAQVGDAGNKIEKPDLNIEIQGKLGQVSNRNSEPKTMVQRCLRDAATEINSIAEPRPQSGRTPTHFMVSLVKTKTSSGYLLTTLNDDPVLESTAFSELTEIFKSKLKANGEDVIEMTPPLLFEQEMLDFLPWAEASSYFVSMPDNEEQQFVYIYVEAPLDDVLLTETGDDMFSVPLSTMRSDIKLTFDMYMALPKNNKYLLYRRKGSVFTDEAITKFEKHKVDKIFIRREDQNLYYAYRASAFVAEKRKAKGF